MLKNFENWLLEQNYKLSTAFDYMGRIERLRIHFILWLFLNYEVLC